MKINEQLLDIQINLKAPKDLLNKFGGFKYRSAESILENAKPLLNKAKCNLTLTDDIVLVGDRYYVKSTATLTNADGESISCSAFAREEESFKGMSLGQLSGSTCSYARKYALCGLFAINDGGDLDELDSKNAKSNDVESEMKNVLLGRLKALKPNEQGLCNYFKVKSINDLTCEQLEKAISMKKGE